MSHQSDHAYKLSVLNEIDSTTPRAQGAPPTPFDQACSMEKPLRSIRNFALALDRVAQTLNDGNGAAIVQEIGLTIKARVEELDDIHEFFFQLHHPDRE